MRADINLSLCLVSARVKGALRPLGESFIVVAVWASPKMRYSRLANRSSRKLTLEEAASRDRAEIENINKGGPIAMADFTILNESSLADLRREVERIISRIK